jgi:hypothetical protein
MAAQPREPSACIIDERRQALNHSPSALVDCAVRASEQRVEQCSRLPDGPRFPYPKRFGVSELLDLEPFALRMGSLDERLHPLQLTFVAAHGRLERLLGERVDQFGLSVENIVRIRVSHIRHLPCATSLGWHVVTNASIAPRRARERPTTPATDRQVLDLAEARAKREGK